MIHITCLECGHAFELSEEKIPSPKFNIKCPESHLDNIRKDVLSSLGVMAPQAPNLASYPSGGSTVEKRALVCESDPAVSQQIVSALVRLGYSVQSCGLLSEALNSLESGFYDVITTELSISDDPEGGQKLLNKVNSRKLDERRRMFLIVISRDGKTLGPAAAFFHGANIFIQKSDLYNFETLLQDGIRYYAGIYGNYFEVLTESAERI
jgi:CheY-like chemotaxis protein